TTVRNGRKQLVQQARILRKVFEMYAAQVDRKELSTSEAQDLARQWINELGIDKNRFSFVFNHDLIAIASGRKDWLGTNISELKDFKGHGLAASAYQEAVTTGQSFA